MRISSQQLERLLREYRSQQAKAGGQAAAGGAGAVEPGQGARTGSAGGAAAGGGRDTVDFSPAAQQLLRSREAGVDPQRAAQIEAIRRRLQAGTYRVSGEEVARAWLRRLVADQVAQRLETSSAQSGSSGSGGGDAAPRP